MNVDDLTIGQLKQLQSLVSGAVNSNHSDCDGQKRIVILDRGWVAVGDFYRSGEACELRNGSIIRRWGTTKGLGELVNGPLPDTELDNCGVLRFDARAIIATMDCIDGW